MQSGRFNTTVMGPGYLLGRFGLFANVFLAGGIALAMTLMREPPLFLLSIILFFGILAFSTISHKYHKKAIYTAKDELSNMAESGNVKQNQQLGRLSQMLGEVFDVWKNHVIQAKSLTEVEITSLCNRFAELDQQLKKSIETSRLRVASGDHGAD